MDNSSKGNKPLVFNTLTLFWSAQDLDPYGYPILPKAAIPFAERVIKIKLDPQPCILSFLSDDTEVQQNKSSAQNDD
jgi:hypothetical protein